MVYLSINITVLIETSIIGIYFQRWLSGTTARSIGSCVCGYFAPQLKALIAGDILETNALCFAWKEYNHILIQHLESLTILVALSVPYFSSSFNYFKKLQILNP